ncbi:MXAN_6640 family putative metalloprotease [Nocardioides insulae]|uniref:MXAN_6640 family putative metalloprotease n=1 Tax=Nocardioides insulae TaxID=394734 RepID=UPI0004228C45|nr:MXAN_6640 family putative metalloprotease [Nocardioides insulae]
MSSPRTVRRLLVVLPLLVPGLLLGPQAFATPSAEVGESTTAPGRALPTADDLAPVSERDAAERVLADAQSLMRAKPEGEAQQTLQEGRDVTMLLRDLWLREDDLSASDRVAARSLNQRPAYDRTDCSNGVVCVHWNTSGPNRASQAYVNQVVSTMGHVHRTYRKAGYRSPKSDKGKGGNNLPDVYLQDVYNLGFYGYCTVDAGTQPPKGRWDVPAFCVLDNDYATAQYGSRHTPLENLRVTAAHEYFHAVQFAYDATEDRWLMEGTAVWAEDEVYNGINDNRQYLRYSPLTSPRTSMDDASAKNGFMQYGDWIFFRFLSEQWGKQQGGMPVIVRQIWQRADSSRGPRYDQYSSRAVSGVVRSKKTQLRKAFARFAAENRNPRATYREGRAGRYPAARPAGRTVLRPSKQTATRTYRINHLASATQRYIPRKLNPHRSLRVSVDLPRRRIGTAAMVSVQRKGGAIQRRFIKINAQGNGSVAVPFNPRRVKHVEVTLANASTAMNCWRGTDLSCAGKAKNNGAKFKVSAKVVKPARHRS